MGAAIVGLNTGALLGRLGGERRLAAQTEDALPKDPGPLMRPAKGDRLQLGRLTADGKARQKGDKQPPAMRGEQNNPPAFEQLSFSFFQSARVEAQSLFEQRTTTLAQGLDGPVRQTFTSISTKISAEFEVSFTLTASALNGFADSAEKLVSARELFEKLMTLANGLIEKANETFNEFFSLLSGAPIEKGPDPFMNLFRQLAQSFLGNGAGPGGAGAITLFQGVQLEFSFSASFSFSQEIVMEADPIILDFTGDGFNLTSYKKGAQFDLLGDGKLRQTAFVYGGDAFLALDRNGNGIIDSGKELFGDQHGAANGYEELRKFDDNGDGVIDSRDAIYKDLLLWFDNGNGISEAGELKTLEEAGVTAIHLNYKDVDFKVAGGNRMTQIGAYTRSDGSLGKAGDVMLNYLA